MKTSKLLIAFSIILVINQSINTLIIGYTTEIKTKNVSLFAVILRIVSYVGLYSKECVDCLMSYRFC